MMYKAESAALCPQLVAPSRSLWKGQMKRLCVLMLLLCKAWGSGVQYWAGAYSFINFFSPSKFRSLFQRWLKGFVDFLDYLLL